MVDYSGYNDSERRRLTVFQEPHGGWGGWTLNSNCFDTGIDCRYMGNAETPEKILYWFHGAS